MKLERSYFNSCIKLIATMLSKICESTVDHFIEVKCLQEILFFAIALFIIC